MLGENFYIRPVQTDEGDNSWLPIFQASDISTGFTAITFSPVTGRYLVCSVGTRIR